LGRSVNKQKIAAVPAATNRENIRKQTWLKMRSAGVISQGLMNEW
jgi:hypothetical protein